MTQNNLKKKFTGTLVLNWKTGAIRILKKRSPKEGPFEIPIRFEIDVKIPKNPEIVARGSVEVPPNKVEEMVIESL